MTQKRNNSAFKDGQKVRAKHEQTYSASGGKQRRTYKMAPEQVIEIIKKHVMVTMGEWMYENCDVRGDRGFFYIRLPYRRPINHVEDDAWRAMFREGIRLRRYSIGLALRAMHGEHLTE